LAVVVVKHSNPPAPFTKGGRNRDLKGEAISGFILGGRRLGKGKSKARITTQKPVCIRSGTGE